MTHQVYRWHSNADARLRDSRDTIEGHQLRVARMVRSVAIRFGIRLDQSELEFAANHHDEAEKVLGDMPGPAKARFPALAAAYADAEAQVLEEMGLTWTLTRQEAAILDLCDKLDAYEWAAKCGAADTDEWRDALDARRKQAAALGLSGWLEERLARFPIARYDPVARLVLADEKLHPDSPPRA